jgi:hypothetical protein
LAFTDVVFFIFIHLWLKVDLLRGQKVSLKREILTSNLVQTSLQIRCRQTIELVICYKIVQVCDAAVEWQRIAINNNALGVQICDLNF